MKYLQPKFTMDSFHPQAAQCCERCAFNRGDHADWCTVRIELIAWDGVRRYFSDFTDEVGIRLTMGDRFSMESRERLNREIERLAHSLGRQLLHGDTSK